MQRFRLYYAQDWYIKLTTWQKELVRTSLELYAREERLHSEFTDYSFVVFPMAKAYEGFLKQFFYEANFINQHTFIDKRFRIGRALNPDMNPAHQDDWWIYPHIAEQCGEDVARSLWDTWLECRNRLFHYFPGHEKRLDLAAAEKCLEMIITTIEMMDRCQLRNPELTQEKRSEKMRYTNHL